MKIISKLIFIIYLLPLTIHAQRGARIAYIDMDVILSKNKEFSTANNLLDEKISQWKKEIELKILDEMIRKNVPSYETIGSAGMDLRACIEDKILLKGLTRKELRDMKRKKKEQDIIARYKAMGLNQWGIDENAQTWYLALKYHLPTSRQSNGLPILRQYQTFTEESSKIYPLWIINGQQFNSPPLDVQALSPLIRKVKILVSAAETNRWGKQARAGVIVLETLR